MILDLVPASSPQVPHSHSVHLVYEFVKHTTIPAVK